MDHPLHCPKPQPLAKPPYDLAELDPLLIYLRRREASTQAMTFPRGTVQPDGRLDLCKQDLGVEGCRLVMAALRGNPLIRSLMLGTDAIGDPGARDVAAIIRETPSLETLYLGCNAIGPEGIDELATAIEASPHVQALWLKRNPIGAAGTRRVAEMLGVATHLRVLDLVHTQLDANGLEVLVPALKANGQIERLYLGGNSLGPECASLIADLMASPQAPVALFLNVNQLGDNGVRNLISGLRKNESLRELGLGSNGLTAACAPDLAELLRTHPRLQRLELGRSPSTRILGATANRLEDSGAEVLAHALPEAPSLCCLELDHNGIGLNGQLALANAVGQSSIVELKIDGLIPQLALALARQKEQRGTPSPPRDVGLIRSVYR